MKREFTNSGWKEITVTNVVVAKLGQKPVSTVEEWLGFNARFPKIGRKRAVCNCCGTNWNDLSGHVNLAFTNKGNKAVCDTCFNQLKTNQTDE